MGCLGVVLWWAGWIEYDVDENIWDVHAGLPMPGVDVFVGGEVKVWSALSHTLVQSSKRPSTRRLYQRWLLVFFGVCAMLQVPVLPVASVAFEKFLTRVAHRYAFGTVQIAASAVIDFCLFNNFQHPCDEHPRCKLILKAARSLKGGLLVTPKDPIDPQFLLAMWDVFLGGHGLWGCLSCHDARSMLHAAGL